MKLFLVALCLLAGALVFAQRTPSQLIHIFSIRRRSRPSDAVVPRHRWLAPRFLVFALRAPHALALALFAYK